MTERKIKNLKEILREINDNHNIPMEMKGYFSSLVGDAFEDGARFVTDRKMKEGLPA